MNPPVRYRHGIRELVAPDAAWRFGEGGLRHFEPFGGRLIRNTLLLGPYSGTMPRDLW